MTAGPGQLDEGAGPASETLFLDSAFNAFQAQAQGKRLVTFSAGEAHLTLGGVDGAWSSPVTGAFGGIVSGERVRAADVFAVVADATAWLRAESATGSATVRLPPGCFDQPGSAALENALARSGWRLEHSDINHHLPVSTGDAFRAGLGETKRKELRRLERSGALVAEAGLASRQAIYEIIAENRRSLGYPMTMAWPQVEALADAFPERVRFFAVERDRSLLAGAICLRVTAQYLYVFYWGERSEVRKESPVTLLADGLLAQGRSWGVSILDIGISTDRSVPNPGLIAFKESLGCLATSRRTYRLDLG